MRIWGVDHVLPALGRVARTRSAMRRLPELGFGKVMGTGSARTFTPRDADLHHWALLTVWSDASAAASASAGITRSWDSACSERLHVTMRPLASRGRWARQEPFGPQTELSHHPWTGPVAAITRARLRPTRAMSFWRAVPPVVDELDRSPGLRMALGIGEAPIGLQGTFSVWDSSDDLTGFAYRSPRHRAVVQRTDPARWYAEELFTRLAVTDISGTYRGQKP
ncbi:monooxygenase [Gordonia hankookensis]|uniref:Monooxygenase n=1 Tax=Gordonia hankookensis TaxID=589403 RepID=A0ABR7WBC9_9ACTN|nr:monooxygenase [Gordonia hankookensis]MBD1320125.1 monooxygenase [Gordonia hankookensis]